MTMTIDYDRLVDRMLELILDGEPQIALRTILSNHLDHPVEPPTLGRALRRVYTGTHGAPSIPAMEVLRGMIALERMRAERFGTYPMTASSYGRLSPADALASLCPAGNAVDGVDVEQRWGAGETLIRFADGSALVVDDTTVRVIESDPEIAVSSHGPSTLVDTKGAVDAEVAVGAESYSVTLIPNEYSGELDMWGDLDNWLSGPHMGDLAPETLTRIVDAVVAAASEAE